jgi:hypothetical protein
MKRSAITITAFVMSLLLVLTAGIYPFIEGNLSQRNSNFMGIRGGQFQGNIPPDGVNGQDLQSHSPGALPGQSSDGQSFQPGGNMPSESVVDYRLLQVIRWVLAVLVILLGAISATGIWFIKKWGSTLAVITAILAIGSAVLTFLGLPRFMILVTPAIQIFLGIAVIVFAILAVKKIPQTVELT